MRVNVNALTDLELAAILANPAAFYDGLLNLVRREVQQRVNRTAQREEAKPR
jgi:hypothetical protein